MCMVTAMSHVLAMAMQCINGSHSNSVLLINARPDLATYLMPTWVLVPWPLCFLFNAHLCSSECAQFVSLLHDVRLPL